MNILFLDDDDLRHRSFSRNVGVAHEKARTAVEAIACLRGSKFDLVFLDHDLKEEHYAGYAGAYGHDTGMEVVQFICGMDAAQRPKMCVVHSMNTVEAPRMVAELQRVGVRSAHFMFGSKPFMEVCKQISSNQS